MRARTRQASSGVEWTVFIVTAAVSLILLLTSPRPGVREVKSEIGDIVSVFTEPLHAARMVFSIWSEYESVKKQALQLSEENAQLRDAMAENQRLRAMLGMRTRTSFQTISASVISAVGPALGGEFRIDAGRIQGVGLNAAVVTPVGLVGKTVEVTDHTALIKTLVGNSYGVGVMLERTRMRGILRWSSPDHWTLSGLPQGVDIKSGDLVLTSGIGSVFPKGLRVGVVTDLPSALSTLGESWTVQPFVDFRTVEDVFVITSTGWPDPYAGLDDAREGRP
jgi:rod shape-determining protein MreC